MYALNDVKLNKDEEIKIKNKRVKNICSIVAHPGRPALQDSPQARVIFQAAERNRTDDGFITPDEFKDIFATFDINSEFC